MISGYHRGSVAVVPEILMEMRASGWRCKSLDREVHDGAVDQAHQPQFLGHGHQPVSRHHLSRMVRQPQQRLVEGRLAARAVMTGWKASRNRFSLRQRTTTLAKRALLIRSEERCGEGR